MQAVELAKRSITGMDANVVAGLVIASEEQSSVAESCRDDIERAAFDIIGYFLLETGDGDPRLANDVACGGRYRAIEELHDRALAGAIATQQADPLAALNCESRTIENWWATKRDGNILHSE